MCLEKLEFLLLRGDKRIDGAQTLGDLLLFFAAYDYPPGCV